MSKSITVANLVKLIGGGVTFIFSFLNFFEYAGEGRNAWSSEGGAWLSTIPAILGLAMLIVGILELTGQKLPDQVLTYNWKQITGTWGIGAVGVMLAWMLSDWGGADKGIGFWFMFLGSIAMCTGAVMDLLGKGSETVKLGGGGTTAAAPPPPPPGMTPPPPPPPPAG